MNRFTKLLCCAPVIGLVLASPRPALAADCVTDMDCPGADCGGQVCQWLSTTSHVCQAAGGKSRGSDGWCNTIADCKCQGVGAKCNAQFSCSFVLPADAPPAGGAGGASGAGGSGGASAGSMSAGTGGSSVAGDSSNGGGLAAGGDLGASTSAGTSSNVQARPDGPITGSPSAPDAGGCQIGALGKQPSAFFGLGLLAGALLFLRRRSSAER